MYPPGRGLYPLPPENTRKVWKRLVILGVGFVLLAQTYAGPIAALAATIQTDLFVYQNGDTVTVTGDGFGAAEVVDLVTTDPAATVVNHGSATTDGVGKLTYQFTLTTTVPGLYDVTATGQTSGLTASTQFDPPPTPPTNLRYRDDRSSGAGVTLSWPSVGQQSVDCYFVYRSNSSMATLSSNTTVGSCAMPHTNINSLAAIAEVAQASGTLQYVDSAAPAGSIFYYVTAEKVGNNQGESGQSNQVATTSLNPSSGSASHDFGNVTVGTTSSFTSARYNNNSGAAITLRAFAISGANPGDFAVANVSPAVGTSIANGGAVTFTVTFTPGALGARSGSVEVNAQDANQSSGVFNTHVMPVVGNGVSASGLSAQSASGAYGGTVSLQATLTSGGSGVSGKPIQFSLNGNSVGSATTNSSGVATLSSASLAGINVGNYLAGVSAAFPGDSSYAASSGASSLTVTPASLNVTANDKTRQYGIANPALDATITCTQGTLSAHSYAFVFGRGTWNVTQAVLTVTADPQSRVYGAGNPALTYIITGFVNGDAASVVSGTANCSTTATLLSGVGGYSITCTQGTLSATNYTFGFVAGTLTVTQATLTVTANSHSREYGDANPILDATISGLKNGENLASSGVTGTASCSTAATTASAVANYSITCTIGSLSAVNYSFTFAAGTLHVTPAGLTVTANDKTREYGDPNPGFDATITGFKNGQNLTTSGVTGTASCSSSATMTSPVADYSITCTIGGLLSGNYSFTFFAPGTLHVTKAVLTVTADDKSRQYGDANPAFDATISGFKNGENLATSGVTGTASCSSAAIANSTVADHTISCTIGTLSATNYTFSFVGGTLTVTQATLTVTANSHSREYGDANPILDATISGLKNGENLASSGVTGTASCSTAATTASAVANYSITCTIGSLSAVNYSFTFAAGTLHVTPAGLTVTAYDKTREYGDPNPGFDATITGFKNGQNLTTSGVTGTASCSSSATMTSPVADYSITCTIGGLLSGNYSFTFFAPGTLHVTKAVLTVTADDKSRQYGDANPAFDATISGFKNGENLATSGVTGTASCSSAAIANSTVADHTISCTIGTLSATNYTFSFVGGTLTVTQATLTVTANSHSREYGDANPILDATISGLKNGENLASSGVTGTASCSTAATTASAVANYSITCTIGSLSAVNYSFTFAAGTLHVTPAGLTVTAYDKTREYGDPNPGFDATITGFKNGQNLTTSGVTGTASCSSSATMTSPVADYSITCTIGGLLSGNYSFTFFAPGTLHVTKAVLTVTADDKSRQYGDANPAFDATISGFKNGENLATSGVTGTASCSSAAIANSTVADHTISCTIGSLSAHNYSFSFVNGTLRVTTAELTVTANSHSREYGDANPILDATISGLKNGENLASSGVTGTARCCSCAAIASRTVAYRTTCSTVGSLTANNCSSSFVPGTLHVTTAELTVTANDHTREYGDANPAFDATISGFKNGENLASS